MPNIIKSIISNNNDKLPKVDGYRSPDKKTPVPLSMKMGESKRLTLTYIVLVIWIALAIFGIIVETDLYALAVYFTSGLPLILGYLWSETSRPSIKDAAQLVKNINPSNRNNNQGGYGEYNNYGGYGGQNRGHDNYNGYDDNTNINTNNLDTNIEISIFSDDSSVELKTDENKLNTLMNTGYVDTNGDKYTFKKGELEQVKSLINDSEPEPNI